MDRDSNHASGDLLLASRASGSFEALSPELARLIGACSGERRSWMDSLHAEDVALTADWLSDLESSTPVRPLRVRMRDSNGAYRMIEWTGMPLPHRELVVCSGRVIDEPRVLQTSEGIELDPHSHSASVHGRLLDLTLSEFNILRLLLDRHGEAISANTIAREAFGYETAGNRNFIQAHMSRLRKKLKHAGAGNTIETIRGFGYGLR